VIRIATLTCSTSVRQPTKLISTTTRPINVGVGGGAHRTAFEYLMEKGRGNRDQVKPIKFNGPQPTVMSVASFDPKQGGTEFGIMPIAVARPLVEAGKVKPIGFTGTQRMPQFPSVPLLNTVSPGINVYAAWSIQLPKGTPQEIVDWYQKTFSIAIKSKEYADWRELNVVFYVEDELTPMGLKKQMDNLRTTFLPVLEKIDLSKE
jgi:tripartite-type tricarboxylate transporter receptor subunit TctC